jgi:hypothetical protein
VEAVGFPAANGCFFAGVAFFAIVVALVPEPDCTALLGPQPKDKDLSRMGARRNSYDHLGAGAGLGARRPSIEAAMGGHTHIESGRGKPRGRASQEVLSSGLITALGIAIHNFPEGIAVFLASMKVRCPKRTRTTTQVWLEFRDSWARHMMKRDEGVHCTSRCHIPQRRTARCTCGLPMRR